MIRSGGRHVVIPNIMQVQTHAPRTAAAAAADWWLSGGVDTGDCWCAYQPKGAASYAASLTNLNDPGTNDGTDLGTPGWSAETGWQFGGGAAIGTNFVPQSDQSQSVIVQFSDNAQTVNAYLFGQLGPGGLFGIRVNGGGGSWVGYENGGQATAAPILAASGNAALAGDKSYRDGVEDADSIGAWTDTPTLAVWIGDMNYNDSAHWYSSTYYCIAIAFYSVVLTDAQVAAMAAAMAAL